MPKLSIMNQGTKGTIYHHLKHHKTDLGSHVHHIFDGASDNVQSIRSDKVSP